ncbi:CRISPR-associated endonuclease Cas9 [Sedimentisphaera cyanobacteriorum]|uniref:CRISPR-associated endonuclease Cas9 n=1 Tax=Sedimentisphaera cyanobacteriorum TaxID=1940790 RepID=A0A1Q2HM83_9BACT|nr:type II CRISPR RNA-guided endonuclease Cas9 [Sedimentisphaera cyanobacteriorum]AQQ08343.1 CRISPR-associated endonuclease Cas9 [Sedimentisphaera cyanobacteriorum]
MAKNRVVLGLDIGIGSVGWALVNLEEEEYDYQTYEGEHKKKLKISGGEIIDSGVRTFQPPHNEQKSLAKIRGEKRRARLTGRRKTKRMKRFVSLAKEFGLIEPNIRFKQACRKMIPPASTDKNKWSPWNIRKEALSRKLTNEEFFRALYHIARHRGVSFLTKAEESEKPSGSSEEGKVKKGLQNIREQLKESRCQTIGEMFAVNFLEGENVRLRNSENDYTKSIHRNLLKDETIIIFKKQKALGNESASDELLRRYLDEVLLYEAGIQEDKLLKMMNRCKFTGEICAPREGYLNERYVLLNRLNSLLIGGKPPTDEQRESIKKLAYKNKKLKFSQIRNFLDINENIRFNLCSYQMENPEYNQKLSCKVNEKEPLFEDKHQIKAAAIQSLDRETGTLEHVEDYSQEYKELIRKVYARRAEKYGSSKVQKIDFYYYILRAKLEIPSKYRFVQILNKYPKGEEEFKSKLEYLKQFESKQDFVELKGYHKIKDCITNTLGNDKWSEIADSPETIEAISEALVYHKTDETRGNYFKEKGIDEEIAKAALFINMKEVANFSKEAFQKLLPHMEEGKYFEDARIAAAENDPRFKDKEHEKQSILQPYHGDFENNPVVMRTFSQTRKLINAVIRKYSSEYPIDQINIEIATELASSQKKLNDIYKKQTRYRDQKEQAKELCREFGLNPEEGQNLLRFRLAMQQKYRCPYTGQYIHACPYSGEDISGSLLDCEIDHIIPISRSFDDSLNNKVLCTKKANQEKKNMLPFEYLSKDPKKWEEFVVRVGHMGTMPSAKKRKLLTKKFDEEDKDRFISRNLNDTRYAAKEIAGFLKKHLDFSKSQREDINEKSRVQLRSGRVTSFLRYHWGLKKHREENDLHHALDAIVVACSTQGHVYLASMIAKDLENKGKAINGRLKNCNFEPWESFREDVLKKLDDIFVSRMPRRKVTGEAHSQNPKSWRKANIKGRVQPFNKGFCGMGHIVRADFYKGPDGKNYAVPLYASDFAAKSPLPSKYLSKGDTPYEDWPELTNEFEFKFSLFKDDLVKFQDQMYYIDYIRGGRPVISLKKYDGSSFDEEGKSFTKEFSYKNAKLEKFEVDMMGKYYSVKKPEREGNSYEKEWK